MLIFQKRPFHSIRAIIFDMDGTLIDSIDAYHAILKDVMERLGMELTFSREVLFETFSQGKKLSDIIFPPDLENRRMIVEQFQCPRYECIQGDFLAGQRGAD